MTLTRKKKRSNAHISAVSTTKLLETGIETAPPR